MCNWPLIFVTPETSRQQLQHLKLLIFEKYYHCCQTNPVCSCYLISRYYFLSNYKCISLLLGSRLEVEVTSDLSGAFTPRAERAGQHSRPIGVDMLARQVHTQKSTCGGFLSFSDKNIIADHLSEMIAAKHSCDHCCEPLELSLSPWIQPYPTYPIISCKMYILPLSRQNHCLETYITFLRDSGQDLSGKCIQVVLA